MSQTPSPTSSLFLILDDGLHALGGHDPLGDLGPGRGDAGELLLVVDLLHLGGRVGRVAVAQLLHGVDAGSLEELGELLADAWKIETG